MLSALSLVEIRFGLAEALRDSGAFAKPNILNVCMRKRSNFVVHGEVHGADHGAVHGAVHQAHQQL